MAQANSKSRATDVEVGGISVTREEVRAALMVLTTAKGIMVKQPLAKAGNPLAACDYHAAATEERANEGSEALSTKAAFIAMLERLSK